MIGVADIVAFRGRLRGDVLVYEALSLELEVGYREARIYQLLHVTVQRSLKPGRTFPHHTK